MEGPCLSRLRVWCSVFETYLGSGEQTRVRLPESSPLPSLWPVRPPCPRLPHVAPCSSPTCHLLILRHSKLSPASGPLPMLCPFPGESSLALPGLRLLDYKMRVTVASPTGLRIGPCMQQRPVVTAVSRPAKAGFLLWPHPDLWPYHRHVCPWMTSLAGVPEKPSPRRARGCVGSHSGAGFGPRTA